MIVYSCIFGKTDPLTEPVNPGSTRFVMFTDQNIRSRHWEIVRVPETDTPKRLCRTYKQLSHVTFPDAEVTLWLDAQMQLLVDPAELLKRFPGDFTGFKHHKRSRIRDEAPAIVLAGKGKPEGIYAQLRAYHADGWDTDANPQRAITNGGFMLRRHTDTVRRFNELWNHEVQTRTLRDQMSLDYCAAKVGLRIDYVPGNMVINSVAKRHSYPRKPTNDF